MKIRIKFRKHGTMKFIGHLDVMCYFRKAICKVNVDICYNGGFSPHQIMSFAAPLGVGDTSNGEYADIEVSLTRGSETMKKCLNGMMSEGFEVVGYRGLPDGTVNAMSIVGAGDYTLAFRPGHESEDMGKEAWFQGLIAFSERSNAMVTEKTKCGNEKTNLKPLVCKLRICPEGDGEMEGSRPFMKISAGSTTNVKLGQMPGMYYEFLGKERPPSAFMVQGEEVYAGRTPDAEKEAGTHSFISPEQLDEGIR